MLGFSAGWSLLAVSSLLGLRVVFSLWLLSRRLRSALHGVRL